MSEKIFPTISCDVRLGEQFSEVYCNPRYITAKARELGMDDNDISQLTVHFSAEEPADEMADTHTLGLYTHDDRTVRIFLGHKAALHEEVSKILDQKEGLAPRDKKRVKRNILTKEQITVNETLLHEVRHAADFALMPNEAFRQERLGHHANTYGKRERFEKLFGALGITGSTVMLGGMLDMLNSFGTENPDRPMAIMMGGSALSIIGYSQSNRYRRKNYDSRQQHRDYIDMPWEVRAREYGRQNAADAVAAQPPLLRYRLK